MFNIDIQLANVNKIVDKKNKCLIINYDHNNNNNLNCKLVDIKNIKYRDYIDILLDSHFVIIENDQETNEFYEVIHLFICFNLYIIINLIQYLIGFRM